MEACQAILQGKDGHGVYNTCKKYLRSWTLRATVYQMPQSPLMPNRAPFTCACKRSLVLERVMQNAFSLIPIPMAPTLFGFVSFYLPSGFMLVEQQQ